MAKSTDHVETLPEEFREQIIAGVRSRGASIEAWIAQQPTQTTEALTPEGQTRALFHAVEEDRTSESKAGLYQIRSQEEPERITDLEQRQQNSTTANVQQLEDTQTKVNMKTVTETIKRQRQLLCQVMEETEQQWEETQRERNLIGYLEAKAEQQQEDIDRLTAEKENQYLLIKTLRLKIENVIEKLRESKYEATQEKMQFLKMQAEIYQERETLDRRRNEIINERRKLETIKYDKTSQESKELKETMLKQEQEITERLMTDSLLSAINKNKKLMLIAKEETEKNRTDITLELKRNQKDISKWRDQIEQIKHNMNVNINKIKQRWTETQRYIEMQRAAVPEMKTREQQKKGKDSFDSVKLKLSRIQEEMGKLWDVLEHSEQHLDVTWREMLELNPESGKMEKMKSDSQKIEEHDIDIMTVTQWYEMQKQKRDIENKLALVQYERDEIERIKTKIQTEREHIARDRQLAKGEMDAMQCMRESTERQQQELDNKLQMTKKEIRELEVMNTEIELKKKDLIKMIKMSRRIKEEISRMRKDTEHAKQDMEERHNKRSEQVEMEDRLAEHMIKLQQADRTREIIQYRENQLKEDDMEMSIKTKVEPDMQREIFEIHKIRKMGLVREDTEQRKTAFTEEKNQIKWRNFQEKKKIRKLEQFQERTRKERDELEITKIKIQRQREEVGQKLQDTITTVLLAVGEMKGNIENVNVEINNMQEEMLKDQRKMEKNKEEVKKYMDKLTSMKAQVSRWILTESAIREVFSVNTSTVQEPQREKHRGSLQDQTLEIPTEKERAEDEITNEAMSLQQSMTLEDQHQSEEIKELEHRQSEQFFAIDINEKKKIVLQMQAEIRKETFIDDDQTELTINVKQKEEVEKQISKLKTREEKIKEQIKYAMENMEEKNQEIKRLILDINDLLCQRAETETVLQITVKENENVEEDRIGLLQKAVYSDILWKNTSVFKHELATYKVQVQKEKNGSKVKQELVNEPDLMRLDVEKRTQSQESKKDLQTQTEEMDGGFDKKDIGGADIQRLRAEMYRTREIIRLVIPELKNQPENLNVEKDHKDKDNETEGLLQEIKQFQEFLKMVKTAMRQSEMDLKEEISDMKQMKTTAKRNKRELDQRLEKNLRERDKLDILRIKMQRQAEVTEQKLENMVKVKNALEKMSVKINKKSEAIKMIMDGRDVKWRHLEDLNYKIKATKHDLGSSYLLISQERADLEKIKNQIRQRKDRESVLENTEGEKGDMKTNDRAEINTKRDTLTKNRIDKEIFRLRTDEEKQEEDITLILDQKNYQTERLKNSRSEQVKQKTMREATEMKEQITRQQAEAEIHEMNCLKEYMERQKQELDGIAQTTKREIREMELLKSELEMKRKEAEQIFRKSMRKKEEYEIILNEIQREKELLKSETKKRRRELDQRLEKTLRERDELDVLRIKLQQQMEELAEEKQIITDPITRNQVYREYEKQSLAKEQVRSNREKAENVHQSSEVSDSITDPQNMREKIHRHLQIIRGEMVILENVNVHLGKQGEGLKALKGENMTVRDNIIRLKSQIKMIFEKVTIQTEAEMDEMVQMRDTVKKQKQELDIKLEEVKRERREMEVLKSEMEVKKRENQQMIRKGIRKEQEVKHIWAEIKEEKDALKRETRKRRTEFEQQRERIIREKDELEIMKLKLQRETDRSRGGTSNITNIANQIQKHWELIKICMEKCKHMKKHRENLNGAIKDEEKHIDVQLKIITQGREEVEKIKIAIKRQKEMMTCALKKMQQMQTLNIIKEYKSKEEEIEKYGEKSVELVLREKNLESENEFLKAETLIPKAEKQKQKKDQKERKRVINNIDGKKGTEIPKTKRKLMQTQINEPKQTKKEFLCGQERKKEEQVNLTSETKEKIPSDEQEETLALKLNETLERDINIMEDNLKIEQLCEKSKITSGMGTLQGKKIRFKESDHDKSNQQISKNQKGLAATEQVSSKYTFRISKITDVENEDLDKLKAELKEEREDLDRVKETINKDKTDLELKRSDLLKQTDLLEQDKQHIKEEKDKLEITKTEIQKKREQADSLFDEINREKSNIKDLTLQVQTERNNLQNAMNIISIKQNEQELKDHEIKRQTQELQTHKSSVLAEREELEVLRKDLNKKKEELVVAMNSISGEKEKVSQLKTGLNLDRQKLEDEKDKMKAELSELKVREDQFMNKIRSIQTLRDKVKELNERTCEDIKNKIGKFDQNNTCVQRLCLALEQKLADIDKQRNQMLVYTELMQKEKHYLVGKLSGTVMKQEVMENQWMQEFEMEKQHLNKEKAVLKQDREDLDRVNEMMNKKRQNLEVMRSDILKEIEQTKTELQMKKEHTESLFDEINREKSNIKDLTVQVQRERKQLESVMSEMTSKLKEEELQDDTIRRLKQELESRENFVLSERKEVELLRKNLNKTKAEAEAAMDSVSVERERLSQMKTDIDRERDEIFNEKDKVDRERSALTMREHQVMNKMKVIENLRVKLQQLNERISDDIKHKLESLQQNSEDMLTVYAALKEKFSQLDGQKENVAGYTELLEREKEGLISILSDMVIQKENTENQWKQTFRREKLHLDKLKAELKEEREDLDRVKETINKDKTDLELKRSDLLKQTDLLEQDKQHIKEEKDKLEITKLELQSKTKNIYCLINEINHEKEQLYQMKTSIESVRDMLLNENNGIAELCEIREDQLSSILNCMGSLRAQLKQLNQSTHAEFRKNKDKLEQKCGDILQLNSILQHKSAALDKQKNIITGYYDLIQTERKHVLTMKCDRAVQTEVIAAKVSLQQHNVEKQDLNKKFECEKDILQSDVVIQTEEFEHYWKLKEDKSDLERKGKYLKTKGESLLMVAGGEVENERNQKLTTVLAEDQDDFTEDKMSKRDCLRKIWRDTKMERKEIDQMKYRGHELRNNLEKRLMVINQLVPRTWLQKETEPLKKTKLETTKSDWGREHKILDERYAELQQLKVQMLSEAEKLHIKEKVSRTLTTSDKANQTFQVDITWRDEAVQAMQQASIKMHQEQMKAEETQAASETSSGLLCQLRHYCCRCCCPCCASCKQVCPDEK